VSYFGTSLRYTRSSATVEGSRDAPCYQIRAIFHEVWKLESFKQNSKGDVHGHSRALAMVTQ